MPVDLTIEGAVAKVVLNRPDKLNALTVDMRQSLCDYFAQLSFDAEVRVVVVTGAGRGFCSGADVDRMVGQPHDLRADRERMQRGGHTFIRALHSIEKPTIAAVRGPAVGIGWSIALACDLVVASETARFSQIFRRIGLAPDGGAIWFLTRRLGMAKAKELVFSARFVETEEALALGLVNHVVEDDDLMSKTEELAAELAKAPTLALGLAKKLFHAAVGPSLEDYLEIESMVQPQLHMTADNADGVARVTRQQPHADPRPYRGGPQGQGRGPERHSSLGRAHLLIYPASADQMALLLGIGHPNSVPERIALLTVASAVDGAGDHADLGYVQISAFGDAVAQCQVGVPACQIRRFPRFAEFGREGRGQPGFPPLGELWCH